MGYIKLWEDIITSSIWDEDDKTRIMWVTLMALTDPAGFVAGSVPGLARLAKMSREDAEKAIQRLEAPDPDSRSREFDGRRIEHLPDQGGWVILNYEKFRKRQSLEERREYMRNYMKNRREEDKKERKNA